MALPVGELFVKIKMDLTQFRKDMNTIKKMLGNLNKDVSTAKNMSQIYNSMFKTITNGYANLTKQINQQLRIQTQLHNTNARLRTQIQLQQMRMQQQNTNNANRMQMLNMRLQAQGNRQLIGSLGNVFGSIGRVSGGMGGFGRAIGGVVGVVGRLGVAFAGVTAATAGVALAIGAVIGVVVALGAAAAATAYAIGKVTFELSKQGLQQNATIENSKAAIEAIWGESEATDALYNSLQQLAVESPNLRMEDVLYSASLFRKMLSPEELLAATEIIGDAVATTGDNAIQNFERTSYALSQLYTKEKLSAEEFNKQLANANVPTWDALLEGTSGKTKAELIELMEQGKLTGREWVDAYLKGLKALTEGNMDKMAETWDGQLNIMRESWKVFVAENLTAGQFEELKATLKFINDFFKNLFKGEDAKKNQEVIAIWKGYFTDIGKAVRYLVENLLPWLWDKFTTFSNWFNRFWSYSKVLVDNWVKSAKEIWKAIGPSVTEGASRAFKNFGAIILFIIKLFTWFHDVIQIVVPFLSAAGKTIKATFVGIGLEIKAFFILIMDFIANAVELLPLDRLSAISKLVGVDLGFIHTLADMKETTSKWRKDVNKELKDVGKDVTGAWSYAVINAGKKIDEMRNRKWEPEPIPDPKKKDTLTPADFGDKPPPKTGDGDGGDGDTRSPIQKAFEEHQKKVDYMVKTNQWGLEQVYNSWKQIQAQLGLVDEASAKKKKDGLEYFRKIEIEKAQIVKDMEEKILEEVKDKNEEKKKEIEEKYKEQKEIIENHYKEIDQLEEEQDLKEKRRRLVIKRQSYIGATSAEGLSELAKVNQELADVDKEIAKQAREVEKDTQLRNLESTKEQSLKSLEEQSQSTITAIEKAGNAANIKLQGFLTTATKLKNEFFKAGKGLADGFVAGFGTLSTSVKGAINTVSANAGALANPQKMLSNAGVINNFNGPLVNVQSMYVRDATDINNVGKEMYRTAQKSATAKGGRM